MYVLCVSGAMNTQGLVWKYIYIHFSIYSCFDPGECVCLCARVCACLIPPPPSTPPDLSLPSLFYLWLDELFLAEKTFVDGSR